MSTSAGGLERAAISAVNLEARSYLGLLLCNFTSLINRHWRTNKPRSVKKLDRHCRFRAAANTTHTHETPVNSLYSNQILDQLQENTHNLQLEFTLGHLYAYRSQSRTSFTRKITTSTWKVVMLSGTPTASCSPSEWRQTPRYRNKNQTKESLCTTNKNKKAFVHTTNRRKRLLLFCYDYMGLTTTDVFSFVPWYILCVEVRCCVYMRR